MTLRPKRRLGQHFLYDTFTLDRIAEATGAGAGDSVVEIGPGPGGLTAALLRRGCQVIAIERDPDLLDQLARSAPAAAVVQGDALALDWYAAAGCPERQHYIVAGNIPYNITSPLIGKALEWPHPSRIVFLVQAEVAARLSAQPGTRAYGALTVGVQVIAHVERLFGVRAAAFTPPPRVDSAVVRITPRATPTLPPAQLGSFRSLATGLFGFRRKQLQRALRSFTGWEADRVGALLTGLGVDGAQRPEMLAPETFVALHRALVDWGWQPQ